jgi:hypothetical protein
MIQKVDGVLQFLKDVFMALALAGHIRHEPEGRPLGALLGERAHPHAIPAHVPIPGQGRGETQFFRPVLALAGGLGQPVDGFRDVRRARKKPLHRADVGGVAGAGHGHIGLVSVDDPAFALGHQQAFAAGVGDLLGDVVARRLPGESDEPDRKSEEGDHPDHREHGKKGYGHAASLFGREKRGGEGGGHKENCENQHQSGAACAFRAVKSACHRRLAHVLVPCL